VPTSETFKTPFSGWTDADEAVPDNELPVLAYIRIGDARHQLYGMLIGFHNDGLWYDAATGDPIDVTHWRELPAVPAEVSP
jgi:hypothetical protein